MAIIVMDEEDLKVMIRDCVITALDYYRLRGPVPMPQPVETKEWITEKEAREYLDVSKTTLQRYRVRGIISYSKIVGSLYYKMDDIKELLERNKVNNARNQAS